MNAANCFEFQNLFIRQIKAESADEYSLEPHAECGFGGGSIVHSGPYCRVLPNFEVQIRRIL
jgi:hypothetical protein